MAYIFWIFSTVCGFGMEWLVGGFAYEWIACLPAKHLLDFIGKQSPR